MRWIGILLTLAVVGTSPATLGETNEQPPEYVFSHSPFDDGYASRLTLSSVEACRPGSLRAPNSAHAVTLPASGDATATGAHAWEIFSMDRTLSLAIGSEGESCSVLEIRDRYPNFVVTVRWVNEKLLFVRTWWGRALGTDVVVDVEAGSFVLREMVRYGPKQV